MATAKYTRSKTKDTPEQKAPADTAPEKTKEKAEEYVEPVPTTSLLELEILRSTTCDSEVAR